MSVACPDAMSRSILMDGCDAALAGWCRASVCVCVGVSVMWCGVVWCGGVVRWSGDAMLCIEDTSYDVIRECKCRCGRGEEEQL